MKSDASNSDGQETFSLRTDLEDLISRVHTLSKTDLEHAKERWIQKIAPTRGVATNMAAVGRKKWDRGIKHSTVYIKEHPLKSVAYVAITGIFVGAAFIRAFHTLTSSFPPCNKPDCCNWPRCWCDEYTDAAGVKYKARCSDPNSSTKCCMNPDQDKYCNYNT